MSQAASAATVNDTDSGITYTGSGWGYYSGRGIGDFQDDVHATPTNGDSVSYSFTGTSVSYVTETNTDEGNVQVYLDGTLQATVNCNSAARNVQQAVWSKSGLASGAHTLKLVKQDGSYMLLDALQVQAAAASGPTPYGGTPVSVAATGTTKVEAENYDLGGEGVAYHDIANGGDTAYRTDNIGVEAGSVSNGYYVTYTANGEWDGYTLSVASAGTYTLTAAVSSPNGGGTFHLEFGPVGQVGGAGVTKSAEFTAPNTGSYSTFQTISMLGISLPAGPVWMRLVIDSQYPCMFDDFTLASTAAATPKPTPYSGTAVSVAFTGSTKIEAENYDKGGEGVAYHDVNNSGSTAYRTDNIGVAAATSASNGFDVGATAGGEWDGYTINVATAGVYTPTAFVGSSYASGTFHLEFGPVGQVGGTGVVTSGEFTFPNTSSFTTFQPVTTAGVSLPAGLLWMRLVLDSAYPGNFDAFTLTPAPVLTSIAVSPNPATLNTGGTQQFTAVANDQNGNPLSPQPAIAWTSTGVGMITTAGFYSAGNTAGPASVIAKSGTVTGNAAVTVNTASRVQITNINNGSILSGDVDVSVFITGSSTGFGDVNLYIDGVELESGQPDPDSQGNNTVVITVPSNGYTNGTHQLKVSDAQGHSDTRTVSFNNVISSLRYDPVMDTNGSASDVPHTAQISATLSSSQQWQIQIQDDSDNVIKSFSGSGTSINVSWDGTNSSGLVVDDDSYDFTITTTPSGSVAPASATSQGANTTNSVTRPIAKDSIGDTLILMDVDALAIGTNGKAANGRHYAKFLHSKLDPKVGVDFTQKIVIFQTTAVGMTFQSTRSRINNKFKVPLNLVYVIAHGNSFPCPYFQIGLSKWYSKDPSITIDPFSYNVRKTVTDAGLGYGEQINPPTLVWMDNCQSAGFNPTSHDFSWADTFGISGEGMFLGWSTGGAIYDAATYGFAPSNPLFNWNGWREILWLNLFSYGNNFITSLNNADQVMQNGFNDPQKLHQYIGNQHASF